MLNLNFDFLPIFLTATFITLRAISLPTFPPPLAIPTCFPYDEFHNARVMPRWSAMRSPPLHAQARVDEEVLASSAAVVCAKVAAGALAALTDATARRTNAQVRHGAARPFPPLGTQGRGGGGAAGERDFPTRAAFYFFLLFAFVWVFETPLPRCLPPVGAITSLPESDHSAPFASSQEPAEEIAAAERAALGAARPLLLRYLPNGGRAPGAVDPDEGTGAGTTTLFRVSLLVSLGRPCGLASRPTSEGHLSQPLPPPHHTSVERGGGS